MNVNELLGLLLSPEFSPLEEEDVFYGSAQLNENNIFILGTQNDTYIGNDTALILSSKILEVIQQNKKEPIVLLIDTLGQKLSHHDELLGLNLYLAHLSKTIELARLHGHKIISLLRNQAVSGGALCTNLLADDCFALNSASMGVMNLPSMSRITQIPLEKLEELSKTSALFDTNVNNYYVMGAILDLWKKEDNFSSLLLKSMSNTQKIDNRSSLGLLRKGRLETSKISLLVQEA